jgi:hypothetical protein
MLTKKKSKMHSITLKNSNRIHKDLKLTILKQGIKSKHVLSSCIFTTSDSYKDADKYLKNLSKFLQQKRIFKEYETRIYTDNSIANKVYDLVKNDKTVTLILFDFIPLYDKKTNGHIGMFGSLIRFLPLFEKGLSSVYISDIDVPDSYFDPHLFETMKKESCHFSYRTYVCYHLKVYGRAYTILAGTMASLITFPITLFNDYIDLLVKPNKWIQTLVTKLNNVNEKINKPHSRLPYGIDEIFCNFILYDYLIKKNISTYILKDYEYAQKLLRNHKTEEDKVIIDAYYKNKNQINFNKLKSLLIKKLPLILDDYPCLKYMYEYMDLFKDSFVVKFVKKGKELNKI